MNKEKCIFCFEERCICQEIINEYNKKRNKEITEEHLYNIEKLRENFKQKVINEYKEKLISFIKEQIQDEIDNDNNGIQYMDTLDLIKYLENGEFD